MAQDQDDTEDGRVDCIVCGRKIGTVTGWDIADTFAETVYDLIGAPEYLGPVGDVTFYFENGTIERQDESGTIVETADLLTAILGCPIERTH